MSYFWPHALPNSPTLCARARNYAQLACKTQTQPPRAALAVICLPRLCFDALAQTDPVDPLSQSALAVAACPRALQPVQTLASPAAAAVHKKTALKEWALRETASMAMAASLLLSSEG